MGTLRVANEVPSANEDRRRLKKAFDGWGTDEKAVIRVLGCKNASQRRIIKDRYQQLYNESLIDHLYSELSGECEKESPKLRDKAVILWTQDPPEGDAKLAKDAWKRKSKGIKHLEVIVEAACASSPHHLMAVRQAYRSLSDCSLEEDITFSVDMPIRKLLAGLASSYRYDKEVVDMVVAKSEAATLDEAIRTKQLDCDPVVWILCTRNYFQLKATSA